MLTPLKLTLSNLGAERDVEAAHFPPAVRADGGAHAVRLTPTIYVDASDFRFDDAKDFFGFAPGKWVGLKNVGAVRVR